MFAPKFFTTRAKRTTTQNKIQENKVPFSEKHVPKGSKVNINIDVVASHLRCFFYKNVRHTFL